jgi:hypothetical protein
MLLLEAWMEMNDIQREPLYPDDRDFSTRCARSE